MVQTPADTRGEVEVNRRRDQYSNIVTLLSYVSITSDYQVFE